MGQADCDQEGHACGREDGNRQSGEEGDREGGAQEGTRSQAASWQETQADRASESDDIPEPFTFAQSGRHEISDPDGVSWPDDIAHPSAHRIAADSRASPGNRLGLNIWTLDDLYTLYTAQQKLGWEASVVGVLADRVHDPDFPAATVSEVRDWGGTLLVAWEPWDSWEGGTEQSVF